MNGKEPYPDTFTSSCTSNQMVRGENSVLIHVGTRQNHIVKSVVIDTKGLPGLHQAMEESRGYEKRRQHPWIQRTFKPRREPES